MSHILVVGSLHYDIMIDAHHRPEKGETVIATGYGRKFGGKGGNQAVAAKLAGTQVKFKGAIGNDEHGNFLISTLQAKGVDTTCVETLIGEPSGMSVAISDIAKDYGAVVVSNANTKISIESFAEETMWSDVSMLLLQNEIPEAINLCAAQSARERGIPVCINAAPAKELSEELKVCISMLVVNGVEAQDMCGIEVDSLASATDAAIELKREFPSVVVTAGEFGVAYAAEDEQGSLVAEEIELVSTHGAGDCFMGTLCAALAEGQILSVAVLLANKAAALHVST